MEENIHLKSDGKAGKIDPTISQLIQHYQFQRLPVEGTLYANTYCSTTNTASGDPAGTAMIGMYCENPLSVSCFHRLTYDEVWHFYGGDPAVLVLLYPDGSSEEILLGSNPLRGERVQWVIPANTWQAGSVIPGGRYSLFGCTMAPGFSGNCFEAGVADDLIKRYPERAKDILRLSVNGQETRMPEGFER